MAFDGDILQIKTFTACNEYAKRAINEVDASVNEYLSNYPADLVHTIHPQTTELTDTSGDYAVQMTRYTVTIVLKA